MEAEKKKPLDLDYNKLFSKKDKDDELVVVPAIQTPQPSSSSSSSSTCAQHFKDMCRTFSEYGLQEKISRIKNTLATVAHSLPDKGAKLKGNLKALEAELESRHHKIEIIKKADDTVEMTPVTPSSFVKAFSRKIDEESDFVARDKDKPFEEELRYLGKGNRQTKRINKVEENGVGLRQLLVKCNASLSRDKDVHIPSNGVQKQKTITAVKFYSSQQDGDVSDGSAKRRRTSEHQPSPRPRRSKVQNVVDLDNDDDCQPIQTVQQQDQCLGRRRDSKIYYPSRLEPASVEICYSDIDCLAPEAFLSSTIMNFYIRYLQRPVSATGKSRADYHFFNTYFYEKLKEAVAPKGETRATFAKLRRWWKGVNIFQKAYIFVPIHENVHWSLVIICIPDREDESGPIILHLDSLGCHDVDQVCLNIKRFLIEEWKYIDQQSSQGSICPDTSIADKIWKYFSRRVEDRSIRVPQQKNEYDCGIFVLYFMERFIEEAPDRLKKKDLVMEMVRTRGSLWVKKENP
ncbi:ubiquitin-like-specific protease 1D isoform X2 [Papaver somniferum]|uniref:ubiquitin-like-specific protease 1D isoform X2 n=1 Tax=Papaver somniferum TaxID=3469 RepID=UPI000E704A73|nr:ubiquitin-like-specific protease 1D isoform X2 [Papaver somniferum]